MSNKFLIAIRDSGWKCTGSAFSWMRGKGIQFGRAFLKRLTVSPIPSLIYLVTVWIIEKKGGNPKHKEDLITLAFKDFRINSSGINDYLDHSIAHLPFTPRLHLEGVCVLIFKKPFCNTGWSLCPLRRHIGCSYHIKRKHLCPP